MRHWPIFIVALMLVFLSVSFTITFAEDELDSDGDGIPDKLDLCPSQPETFNNYQDTDGCPDSLPQLDTDRDGIPDFMDVCPTEPEIFNSFEDQDGCPDEPRIGDETITAELDNAIKIEVNIETNIPLAGETMSIDLKFRDTASGELVKNINYDILATQGNKIILNEEGFALDGHANHKTNSLLNDASNEVPVNVEVTLNGIGLPDNPSTWTGTPGQMETMQVVPEFNTIVMIILVTGIGGIVALSKKSKLIIRF